MTRHRTAMIGWALLCATACAPAPAEREADPLPPQPYGEEASNVEQWLETLELSSRELYAARDAVVAAAALAPGDEVADIGAGTGLYSLLFSQAVGPGGIVYAVDIEPLFLKLIGQRAADLDARNLVAVLSREADVTLPAASVDVVFVADTYHYFTDPAAVIASISEALRPGGRLIVVDHHLESADRTDPALDHIRFGKKGLVDEVSGVGFRLIGEPAVAGLSAYYMVVFEKA